MIQSKGADVSFLLSLAGIHQIHFTLCKLVGMGTKQEFTAASMLISEMKREYRAVEGSDIIHTVYFTTREDILATIKLDNKITKTCLHHVVPPASGSEYYTKNY